MVQQSAQPLTAVCAKICLLLVALAGPAVAIVASVKPEYANVIWADLVFTVLPYVGAYSLAVVVGRLLEPTIVRAWQLLAVEHGLEAGRPSLWQVGIVSMLERVATVTAVILGRGEIILVWLVLKAAGNWEAWRNGYQDAGVEGREVFNITLIGTALSIGYGAACGLIPVLVALGRWGLLVSVLAGMLVLHLLIELVIERNLSALLDARAANEPQAEPAGPTPATPKVEPERATDPARANDAD